MRKILLTITALALSAIMNAQPKPQFEEIDNSWYSAQLVSNWSGKVDDVKVNKGENFSRLYYRSWKDRVFIYLRLDAGVSQELLEQTHKQRGWKFYPVEDGSALKYHYQYCTTNSDNSLSRYREVWVFYHNGNALELMFDVPMKYSAERRYERKLRTIRETAAHTAQSVTFK